MDYSELYKDFFSPRNPNNAPADCYHHYLKRCKLWFGEHGLEKCSEAEVVSKSSASAATEEAYVPAWEKEMRHRLSVKERYLPKSVKRRIGERGKRPVNKTTGGKLVGSSLDTHERHYLPCHSFNRKSNLSKYEQNKFIASLLNFQKEHKFRYKENSTWFRMVNEALVEEYDLFNEVVKNYAHEVWRRNGGFPNFRGMAPSVDEFAQTIRKAKAKRIVEDYPTLYSCIDDFVFTSDESMYQSGPSAPGSSSLTFVQHLLDVGQLVRIQIPHLSRKSSVQMDVAKVLNRFSASDKQGACSIQSDPNAQRLAEIVRPRFVMSKATAICLLSCIPPNYGAAWQIIVTPRTVVSQGQKAVVYFLSNPLVLEAANIIDRSNYFFKYAVLTSLVHPNFSAAKAEKFRLMNLSDKSANVAMETMKAEGVHQDDVTHHSNSLKAANEETQGREPDKTDVDQGLGGVLTRSVLQRLRARLNSNIPVEGENNYLEPSQSGSDSVAESTGSSFLSNIGAAKSHQLISQDPASCALSSNNCDEDLMSTSSVLQRLRSKMNAAKLSDKYGVDEPVIVPGTAQSAKTNREGRRGSEAVEHNDSRLQMASTFDVSSVRPVEVGKSGTKISYDLWSMGPHFVMIRSKQAGYVKPAVGENESASILPHVEYQCAFGASQLTNAQKVRHWAAHVLSGAQVHIRPRIKPDSGEYLAIEQLRAFDLKKSLGPRLLDDCQLSFAKILDMIATTMGDSQLQYLLSHENESPRLIYYKENKDCDKSKSSYKFGKNIHEDLAPLLSEDNVDCPSPVPDFNELWQPIDPYCVLQYHRILQRAPATFDFRQDNMVPDLKGETTGGGKFIFDWKGAGVPAQRHFQNKKWKKSSYSNSHARNGVGSQTDQPADQTSNMKTTSESMIREIPVDLDAV